jgi:hypothetical protein
VATDQSSLAGYLDRPESGGGTSTILTRPHARAARWGRALHGQPGVLRPSARTVCLSSSYASRSGRPRARFGDGYVALRGQVWGG